MTMILIAVHELRGPKDSSDAMREQAGHITLDISSIVAGEPRVPNKDEGEGQRAVAEVPPQAPVEYASEGDRIGQEVRDTVQSRRSSGECRCPPGHIPVCIDLL